MTEITKINQNTPLPVVVNHWELYQIEGINGDQKLLLLIISQLTNEKGYCWASNNYLSKLLCKKPRALQYDIAVLEKRGFFRRELQAGSNKGSVPRKIIMNFEACKFLHTPHARNCTQNKEYNNTLSNARTREEDSKQDTLKHQTENGDGGVGARVVPPPIDKLTDMEKAFFKEFMQKWEAAEEPYFLNLKQRHHIKRSSNDIAKIMKDFMGWCLEKGRRVKSPRELRTQFNYYQKDVLLNKHIIPPHRS